MHRPSSGQEPLPGIVSSAGTAAALTVTQALGRLGVPVHTLSRMSHAAARYSRYTRVNHLTPVGEGGSRRGDNARETEELLDYLLEHVERGVLFPGTDANVRFLAKHKQRLLDAGFKLLIPDEDVLRTALNKSDLALFCKEHGFPVPETVVVRTPDDLDRARELQFPIVLKGVYMKNHAFVETREDLDRVYAEFAARFEGRADNPEAVASEWIPGPSDRFIKLYVVCDHDSNVIAHHTLRRLRVHTRKDGSQGDTLIARTERVQAMIDRWLPFYEKLGWVGVASMECKYDERDGEYKIIEINPRPWAILKVSVDCGVNVPELYYRLAQGQNVEPQRTFKERQYYIRVFWGYLERPEPIRTIGMLLSRRISLWEVLRVYLMLLANWGHVSIDVGRMADPRPTLACMWHYGVKDWRRWFRG